MYRTENLNKSYADGDGVCYALKDVNLDISKGQMVAIVGESGSGKSTLLNILGAIDSATGGKVIANGKNIAGLSEEKLSTYRSKTVGFVFQAFHIIDCYTVYDNIELPLIINKVPGSQRDDMIRKAVARVGLDDKLRTKCNKLSGGEKQRICIARAILKDSPIIIFDEATSFADLENEHKIQLALSHLLKGKTTIMIAHRLHTITGADQICVFHEGRLLEKGKHDELVSKGGRYADMWRSYTQEVTA